jgi:hypothetical protein
VIPRSDLIEFARTAKSPRIRVRNITLTKNVVNWNLEFDFLPIPAAARYSVSGMLT